MKDGGERNNVISNNSSIASDDNKDKDEVMIIG